MRKITRIIFVVLAGVLFTPVIIIVVGFMYYALVIDPLCSEDDIACLEQQID